MYRTDIQNVHLHYSKLSGYTGYEVHVMEFKSSGFSHRVVLQVDTDVSEEQNASILKV
jgi:hypothetical protein